MSLRQLQPVRFPDPSGIACSMMPFIMGDIESIPATFRGYAGLLKACKVEREQLGRIGYLSVQESRVTEKHRTQRKPGIHTEKHSGAGWGAGNTDPIRDGIYMASTVAASCRAWDCVVEPGVMGDCEHLRADLEKRGPVTLLPNTLYWLTDSTPHEPLPMEPRTFRQWFRLVTHKVDLWYARYSTANPLGIVAPCEIQDR